MINVNGTTKYATTMTTSITSIALPEEEACASTKADGGHELLIIPLPREVNPDSRFSYQMMLIFSGLRPSINFTCTVEHMYTKQDPIASWDVYFGDLADISN